MLIPQPVTMLPHLAEKSFANELKLRIWNGDYPCGLNGIRRSLEVKEGYRGSTSEKESRRWCRLGTMYSLFHMGGCTFCRSLKE
jgi:hypothetical protein